MYFDGWNHCIKKSISYFIKITAVSLKIRFCFLAFSRKFLYKVAGLHEYYASYEFGLGIYLELGENQCLEKMEFSF